MTWAEKIRHKVTFWRARISAESTKCLKILDNEREKYYTVLSEVEQLSEHLKTLDEPAVSAEQEDEETLEGRKAYRATIQKLVENAKAREQEQLRVCNAAIAACAECKGKWARGERQISLGKQMLNDLTAGDVDRFEGGPSNIDEGSNFCFEGML